MKYRPRIKISLLSQVYFKKKLSIRSDDHELREMYLSAMVDVVVDGRMDMLTDGRTEQLTKRRNYELLYRILLKQV